MSSRTMLVVTVLVTLVVNLVLDVTTDLPMLARWAIAIPGALVVGAVASRLWEARARRVAGPRGSDRPTR